MPLMRRLSSNQITNATAAEATAELNVATTSLKGLLSAADKTKIDGLGTAAYFNVASSGDAASGEIVKGNDSRLTDARTPTDNSIVDAMVNTSAAILGTKINPNFGNQAIIVTDASDNNVIELTNQFADIGRLNLYNISDDTNNIILDTSNGLIQAKALNLGNGGGTGNIILNGSTSGIVTLKCANIAGSNIIFQLPDTNGSSNYVLLTDGSGVTSWGTVADGILSGNVTLINQNNTFQDNCIQTFNTTASYPITIAGDADNTDAAIVFKNRGNNVVRCTISSNGQIDTGKVKVSDALEAGSTQVTGSGVHLHDTGSVLEWPDNHLKLIWVANKTLGIKDTDNSDGDLTLGNLLSTGYVETNTIQAISMGDLQLGGISAQRLKFTAGDIATSPSNGITPVKWIVVKDTSDNEHFIPFYQ